MRSMQDLDRPNFASKKDRYAESNDGSSCLFSIISADRFEEPDSPSDTAPMVNIISVSLTLASVSLTFASVSLTFANASANSCSIFLSARTDSNT